MKHFVPQHRLPEQAEALGPEKAPVIFPLDQSPKVNGGVFVLALSARCLEIIGAVMLKDPDLNKPESLNCQEHRECEKNLIVKLISESGGCVVVKKNENISVGFIKDEDGKQILALTENNWKIFKDLISNIRKGELERIEAMLVRDECFSIEDINKDALAQKIGTDKVDEFLKALKNPSFEAEMDADFLKKALDIVQPSDQTAQNITNQLTPEEGEVWPTVNFRSSAKTLLKDNTWDMSPEKCRALKVLYKDQILYKDQKREIPKQQRAQAGTTTEELFVPDLLETRITHFKGLVFAGVLVLDPVIDFLGGRKKQLGKEIRNRVASALKIIKTEPKTKSLKMVAKLVDIEQVRGALMQIDFTAPLNPNYFSLIFEILKKEGIAGDKDFDAFFSEKLAPLLIKLCTNSNGDVMLERVDRIARNLPEEFKEMFSKLVILLNKKNNANRY